MIHSESSLRRYLCPQKWALHKLYKIRSAVKRLYLEDGSALHAGLAHWHLSQSSDLEGAQTAASHAYQEALDYPNLWEIEKPIVDERAAYCERVMEAYSRRYPDEEFTVLRTEAPFILPVWDCCQACHLGVPAEYYRGVFAETCPHCQTELEWFVGVIDMIVRRNWDGKLAIIDHKISQRTSPSTMRWVPRSPQLLTYAWGAGVMMQERIDYTMGNYITTLKTIDQRGDPFHRSQWYKITDLELSQHVFERQQIIRQIATAQYFPRNTDMCNQYGLCPMFEICHPYRPFYGELDDRLIGIYDVVDENFEQEILRAQQEALNELSDE